MSTNLNEIKQHISDYQDFIAWFSEGRYVNKNIVDCSRSELREALSYYFRSGIQSTLVNEIINSIQHYTLFSWKSQELNLVEEAWLQKRLRDHGYELPLFEELPTNTQDLKLIKVPLFKRIAHKFYKIEWFYLRTRYHYLIAVAVGLVYFNNWHLLGMSLIATYVLWAVLEIAKHDYMEHYYMVPKNRILKYTIDFILYIFNPFFYKDKSGNIQVHARHHRYWKTDKDDFTQQIRHGFISEKLSIFTLFTRLDDESLLAEYPEFPWLFKYLTEIKIVLCVIFVLLFGPQLFFYIIMIPSILKVYPEGQHDWYMIKFGERDYGFLFPLALNQAWHLTHHKNYAIAPRTWDELFNGPKWIKYVNPQYYIARLFFRLRRQ